MTDDEIEEKLKGLSPTQLSDLLGKLLDGDSLTIKRRQEFLEIQATLKEEIKQREEGAKHVLRGKGPEILELIGKSLSEDNLTPEVRQRLEATTALLSGYQMSFWLPTDLVRKILMFLFLAVGVIGVFQWSLWFGSFIFLGCAFSPRIVGEALQFIGRIKAWFVLDKMQKRQPHHFGLLFLRAGLCGGGGS